MCYQRQHSTQRHHKDMPRLQMSRLLRIGHDHTKIFCKDSPLPLLLSPQPLPYSQESKQQLPKHMPTLFHRSAHWNATQRRAAALLALHLDTEHVITALPSSPSWLHSLCPSLYLQVRKCVMPTYSQWGYPSYKASFLHMVSFTNTITNCFTELNRSSEKKKVFKKLYISRDL